MLTQLVELCTVSREDVVALELHISWGGHFRYLLSRAAYNYVKQHNITEDVLFTASSGDQVLVFIGHDGNITSAFTDLNLNFEELMAYSNASSLEPGSVYTITSGGVTHHCLGLVPDIQASLRKILARASWQLA